MPVYRRCNNYCDGIPQAERIYLANESRNMARCATIERQTAETQITLDLNLDGNGHVHVATGVGFLDHMLTLFGRHGAFDLQIAAKGDLQVDDHHTVEDIGICFGQALRQAVGNKIGIRRYGHFTLPMDETLVTSALDLSGRPFLVYRATFSQPKIGTFDTELVREFWQAFSSAGQLNLHLLLHHGENNHHVSEAMFKATARALRQAVEHDPRMSDRIPSTKETLAD